MSGSENRNNTVWDEDTLRYIAIPAAGLAAVWWSVSGALWLGRGLAGGGWVWPGPWLTARAAVGGLTARIDEWMLLNTDTVAFTAPMWFWSFAALLLGTSAAVLLLGWQAFSLIGVSDDSPQARERKAKKRKLDKDQRAAANSTRARTWPIPGPYEPGKRPGPGVLIGDVRGRPAVSKARTPVLVVGPTGSGKTRGFIGPNLAHWPGPVVATSVRMDLAELTVDYRDERGKSWGFDPSGRLWAAMKAIGIQPTVWDPVRLMRESLDPAADSILLATFLMSQTSAEGQGSQSIWATLAKQMTTRLLWLSRTFEADLAQVLDWVLDPSTLTEGIPDHERALLHRTDQLHLAKLTAMAKKDARIFDSITVTMEEVIESLRHTADNPTAPLLPVGLTTDGTSDTLYMTADHLSQNSHRPLFAAALRHLFHATETFGNSAQRLNLMVQQARHDAETAAGHIDTDVADDPLHRVVPDQGALADAFRRDGNLVPLFSLDEVANLAPLPDLPQITSTLRTEGQLITGIQAVSQLTATWKDNGDAMLANHPTRVQLGGSSDAASMRNIAELSGVEEVDAAAMRMIDPSQARVMLGTEVMFDIDLVDTSKWLDPKRKRSIDAALLPPDDIAPDPIPAAPAPPPTPPAAPPPAPPASPVPPPGSGPGPQPAPTPTAPRAAPEAPPSDVPWPAAPDGSEWLTEPPDRVPVGASSVGPSGELVADDATAAAFASVRAAGRRRPRSGARNAAASAHDPLDIDAARDAAHSRVQQAAQRRRTPRPSPVGARNGTHSHAEDHPDSSDYDLVEPIPLHPPRQPPQPSPETQPPPTGPTADHTPAAPPADPSPGPAGEPSPQPAPDATAAVAESMVRQLSDLVRPSRAELLRVGVFILSEATPAGTSPSQDHASKIAEMLTDEQAPLTAADLLDAFEQALDPGTPR